jgi:hypothetical protein
MSESTGGPKPEWDAARGEWVSGAYRWDATAGQWVLRETTPQQPHAASPQAPYAASPRPPRHGHTATGEGSSRREH